MSIRGRLARAGAGLAALLPLGLGLVLVLAIAAPAARAHTPVGGLICALSPDEATLVVGGDTRTIYVMDAATLEIRQRVWVKTTIWRMGFSKDGSRLVVEDTGPSLTIYDTKTWKPVKTVDKLGYASFARAHDLMAVLESSQRTPHVRVLSMLDGSEKVAIPLPTSRLGAFGLNADGTRLAVLTEGVKDPEEPTDANAPKDLKGVEREEWKQKNDGYTSTLLVFELPEGKKVLEKKTWYRTNLDSTTLFAGGDVLVVNYQNQCARFDAAGEAKLFQLANSYNYGHDVSPDQRFILSGGLANYSHTTVEGLVSKSVRVDDRLPGWPEYFKGFAVKADGSAFGTTTGYRVVRITKDGAFQGAVPVH